MKKIAVLSLSTLLLFGSFFFMLEYTVPGVNARIGTRGFGDFEMDMNISDVSLASFIGEAASNGNNMRISRVGDVNGDGYNDILIGAHWNNEGGTMAGQTYLILGRSGGLGRNMTLSSAEASFIGEFTEDHSGYSVSGAGDVNGDGYDDILIGAYGNVEGGTQAGQAYLILGKASGWSMDNDLANADASFIGEASWNALGEKQGVSGAGDVNGDGYDDFLIGAGLNDEGGANAGQVYLFLGKDSGWTMDTDVSKADASFFGEDAQDGAGLVTGAGDVNGDGYDDFLLGSPYHGNGRIGKTHLILGKSTGWSRDTDLSNADASFIGDYNENLNAQMTISGAGDLNGDGFDDILIGDTRRKSSGGGDNAGRIFLFWGRSNGWSKGIKLTDANVTFIGESAENYAGVSISGAGDVNGDGLDDILIGASGNDEGGISAGQTYLILGKSTGWSNKMILSSSDISFIGEAPFDGLGSSVSGLGDANGDTYDDILIVASGNDQSASGAGKTYFVSLGGYSEPKEVYDITVANEKEEEITIADKLDRVNIEIRGLDSNSSTIDTARANLTFSSTQLNDITISLVETGFNTGVYKRSFIIPAGSEYLENIRFSAYIDQTKFKDIQVNTPIRLGPIMEHIYFTEDESTEFSYYNLGYHAVDQWKINTNAPWLIWDETGQKINGTPDNSEVGGYWINISAEDDQDHSDFMNFTVEVLNSPPSILNDNLEYIHQGEYYEVDYESDDESCGNTEWYMEPSLTWLKFDCKSGLLSGTPTGEDVGNYNLNISVDDGNGGSDSTEFVLHVIDINDPPKITTEPPTSVEQGNMYYVQFNAIDEDDVNTYDWTMQTNSRFLDLNNQTGVLSGTPENDDVGIFFVNVTAEDLRGEKDCINFTLEVIDVNDAPTWLAVPLDSQIDQGKVFTFDAEAIDVDVGDVLTYDISSRPDSDISIDRNTGMITWVGSLEGLKPTPNYVLHIEISATDGVDEITHSFNIQVIPNPPPTSTMIGPEDGKRITSAGVLLEWEGSDDGEEPLRYDIYLGQSHTDVSMLDKSVLWMEDVEDTSIHTGEVERGKIYYWTVIPKDIFSSGICTNDVFSFSVNIPPSIQEFSVPKGKVGVEFRLSLMGSDLNNDDIVFQLIEGLMGMELFNGMLTWTPMEAQVGHHNVNISLYDGYEYVYKEFDIEVEEKEIVSTPDDEGFPIWIIILIIVVLVLAGAGIGVFLFMKNKGKQEGGDEISEEETPPEDTGPTEEEKQAYELLYGPT
ncbi:MAG: FG-GAP repeat protein [Candidatus Thermoplasmatota archaeon]|nr:FG-GAP repeat protein [Candidatus Thermoplasmatota archaeon]